MVQILKGNWEITLVTLSRFSPFSKNLPNTLLLTKQNLNFYLDLSEKNIFLVNFPFLMDSPDSLTHLTAKMCENFSWMSTERSLEPSKFKVKLRWNLKAGDLYKLKICLGIWLKVWPEWANISGQLFHFFISLAEWASSSVENLNLATSNLCWSVTVRTVNKTLKHRENFW